MEGDDGYLGRGSYAQWHQPTETGCDIEQTVAATVEAIVFLIREHGGPEPENIYLPCMRVAAKGEHHLRIIQNVAVPGYRVVLKHYGKSLLWYTFHRPGNIARVGQWILPLTLATGNEDGVAPPSQYDVLIAEQTPAKLPFALSQGLFVDSLLSLVSPNVVAVVMVAEHRDHSVVGTQRGECFLMGVEVGGLDVYKVAREGYQVRMLCVDAVDVTLQEGAAPILESPDMGIAEEDDAIAVESLWQIGERSLDVTNLEPTRSERHAIEEECKGHGDKRITHIITPIAVQAEDTLRNEPQTREEGKSRLWPHQNTGKEHIELYPRYIPGHKVARKGKDECIDGHYKARNKPKQPGFHRSQEAAVTVVPFDIGIRQHYGQQYG